MEKQKDIRQSKLIRLLKILTMREFKEFQAYIVSPLFASNRKVPVLFEILKQFAPNFDSEDLSKEVLLKLLDGQLNMSALDVTMTDMTKTIEEFLVNRLLEASPYYKKHLLFETLLEREELRYFENEFNKITKVRSGITAKDAEFYYDEYRFRNDYNQFVRSQKSVLKSESIRPFMEAFNHHLTLTRLKFSCELLTLGSIDSSEDDYLRFRNDDLPDLLKSSERFITEPLINLYRTALLILSGQTDFKHFEKLLAMLNEYYEAITKPELKDLYTIATNHCNFQIVKGNLEYLVLLNEIHKDTARNGILVSTKHISPIKFKNIVSAAVKIKDFDWAEKFIHDYLHYVSPKFRKSVKSFSMSAVHFYQKNYDKARDHLWKLQNELDSIDVYFDLDIKSLLLKTYYEMGEWQAFDNFSETFKAFIRTNKHISALHRKAYKNFVNIGMRLYKTKLIPSTKALEKLEKTIEERHVSDKPWITKKFKEIKKD